MFQNRLASCLTRNLIVQKRCFILNVNPQHINATTNGGADVTERFPLQYAIALGQFDQAKQLIDVGADVNSKKMNGFTPLHLAIIFGQIDCMKLLMRSGADANHKLHNGETMLHAASGFGRYQCLKVLINARVGVNSTTENGDTPLMYAAMDYASLVYFDGLRKSSEMCVEVLLHEGANINIINKENRNATQMHMYNQSLHNRDYNSRILEVLFAAGEMELCKDSDLQELLCKNSDFAEFLQKEFRPCVKHRLRDKFRKHLLDLDEHENLFQQVKKLGLPSSLARFLVCNVRLRNR